MAIGRSQELYPNLALPFPGGFLINLDGTPGTQDPGPFTQGDLYPLRLYLARQETGALAGTPPTIETIEAGGSIVTAARYADNLQATSLLFSITDFAEGTDDDDRVYYEGTLNLNTTAINAQFDNGANSVPFTAEIEYRNAGNTERRTLIRWSGQILRQIYQGVEGVPVDGDPPYPAPDEIAIIDDISGYTAATVSTTATTTLEPTAPWTQRAVNLTMGVGGGAYTHKLAVGITNPQPGAVVDVLVQLPASANPTLEIRNASGAGTVLETLTNPGAAVAYFNFRARYTGAAWVKFFAALLP